MIFSFLPSGDSVMSMDIQMSLKYLGTPHIRWKTIQWKIQSNITPLNTWMVERDMIMQWYILCQKKCPPKILGFVRYNTSKGFPTPQFSGNEELSSTTTRDNHTVDNNLYVVVHTASDYISLEKLQYEFITSFSLGNIIGCVYIVNVDAI